jgi:signal transduction histidine kinase
MTTTPNARPPSAASLLPTTLTSEGVSGASRRLRALAALSGSLTDALAPQDAADLVEQKALSVLEATGAIVVTLGSFPARQDLHDDAQTLHVVHTIGLPDRVRKALEHQPLDAPFPFAQVARTGEPLFLPTPEDLLTFPDWAADLIEVGVKSAAVVPVWANGELRGVLGLTWAEAHVFDEDERAFVLTLGVMCAQAIMRAHLRDAERMAREVAEHANRTKAQFVATISHELRTPLNAVLGYTALLQDVYGPGTAIQQEHLGRVRQTSAHLISLIEDLLGYARVEAGEEVVHPELIDLATVVEESLVMVRPLADAKGIRIRVDAPATPISLTTPRKLRQILVNLVANAVKFTTVGEVVVGLSLTGVGIKVSVVIEISDTGIGIIEDQCDRVFDPFWRADPSVKHDEGSSGLGLSVARQLARLLGGDVTIGKTLPGFGSTFVVSLPLEYQLARATV